MSIVPRDGLLRKHFEEAVLDIEYTSSGFWQAYFQRAFFETDIYSVTSESSPDGSRRRVDHVVKRYDPNHHTFTALLWIECKRPTGSVLEAENQALDAALRCIAADDLLWIYTVTTVGLSFRSWVVPIGARALQPLHGTAVVADRQQYIGADTDDAYELTKTVDLVKTQTPLRQAPVVPSQSVEDYPLEDYFEEEYPVSYIGENSEQQQSLFYMGEETEPSYGDETAENVDGRGAGRYVEVNVTRVSHAFRADEYIFKDSRNHKKSTTKDEWEYIQYNSDWVWAFRGRRTTYISKGLD